MKKFNPVYAGILVATTALAPASAHAASYYYSYFEISKLNFYAEYDQDLNNDGVTDGTVWARPASDDTVTHKASFTVHSQSQYTDSNGVTTDVSPPDQSKVLAQHVPPAGFFPLGSSANGALPPSADNESFVSINGAIKPPEDSYGQSYGTAGTYPNLPVNGEQFARADSMVDTERNPDGSVKEATNGFGGQESAGEILRTMAEGNIGSAGKMTSNASVKIDAWADLSDLGLDNPGGALPVGSNLGWTGKVRLMFDYSRGLDVRTENIGDVANAAYQLSFEIDQETYDADGNYVGRQAIDVDANGKPIVLPTPPNGFNRQTTVQDGADNRVPDPANGFPEIGSIDEIWDLKGILQRGGVGDILRVQLLMNQQVSGYSLSSSVPEPGTLLLMGAGLLGMGRLARRRKD